MEMRKGSVFVEKNRDSPVNLRILASISQVNLLVDALENGISQSRAALLVNPLSKIGWEEFEFGNKVGR